MQIPDGICGAGNRGVRSLSYITVQIVVQPHGIIVRWSRDTDSCAHRVHPVSREPSLELLVTTELRHQLLEVAPHVGPYARVRLRPLLSPATQPWRHKLADESQPLRSAKSVVIHHPAIIEKQ